MSGLYRIRAGIENDVAGMLALDRAAESLPHWSEAEYAEAAYKHRPKPPKTGVDRCLFVAEANTKIVGFVVAKVIVMPLEVLAELESVVTAAAERRTGIGRALCEAAMEWSRRQGASEMDLEVRSSNEAAIGLYTKLGFAVIGVRPAYYRGPADDALLMRACLGKLAKS